MENRRLADDLLPKALIMLSSTLCVRAGVSPAPLIGRNMVLQRGVAVPVYGKAAAGETVTVRFRGQEKSSIAGRDGRWRVMLDPMEAGGPFEMSIAGASDALAIENVLVGEVWVCSGQSNMAFNMRKALSAAEEIPKAGHPEIRYFRAESWVQEKPAETVRGQWTVCTPDNVVDYSAVAYFFARELHQSLGMPVGIVAGAAGATSVFNWTSIETLKAHPEIAAAIDKRVRKAGFTTWEEALHKYVTYQHDFCVKDRDNAGLANGWAGLDCNDDDWSVMQLPGLWQTGRRQMKSETDIDAGVVWFRKALSIPKAWQGRDLALELGVVDEADITYLNGAQVGATPREDGFRKRRYVVPAALTNKAQAVIAVRVHNTHGRGGFGGPRSDMQIRPAEGQARAISLAGPWRFRIEYRVPWWAMRPPCHHAAVPGMFFNTIAAPFSKYAVRGIVWYQAEGHPGEEYLKAFPLQIKDWRARWKRDDLPFLYVQHARFGKKRTGLTPAKGREVWATTRQAQLQTLSLVPNTAMAVTFDVSCGDLHPPQKREVGERLALAALGAAYGKDLVYSGPLFDRVTREGEALRITFTHVGSGLTTNDGKPLRDFAVAGADGNFVAATAEIREDAVVVRSDAVKEPVSVRYAWADYPAGNLYNQEGLPASPFAAEAR